MDTGVSIAHSRKPLLQRRHPCRAAQSHPRFNRPLAKTSSATKLTKRHGRNRIYVFQSPTRENLFCNGGGGILFFSNVYRFNRPLAKTSSATTASIEASLSANNVSIAHSRKPLLQPQWKRARRPNRRRVSIAHSRKPLLQLIRPGDRAFCAAVSIAHSRKPLLQRRSHLL